MTMTKVRATIKVNDGLVTSFSRMAWRVLFPRRPRPLLLPLPPLPSSTFSVTTPYVGRSIPDEMEYRYAEHPEGSVANIEKFLPERKKKAGCGREGEKGREDSRKRAEEGEGGRVIESFAFLENIIDRLELIGARRRDNWPALVALVRAFARRTPRWRTRRGKTADHGANGAEENSTWNLFSQQCACYCSPRFEMYASSIRRL